MREWGMTYGIDQSLSLPQSHWTPGQWHDRKQLHSIALSSQQHGFANRSEQFGRFEGTFRLPKLENPIKRPLQARCFVCSLMKWMHEQQATIEKPVVKRWMVCVILYMHITWPHCSHPPGLLFFNKSLRNSELKLTANFPSHKSVTNDSGGKGDTES